MVSGRWLLDRFLGHGRTGGRWLGRFLGHERTGGRWLGRFLGHERTDDRTARMAKISGDTELHLAISQGRDYRALQMLDSPDRQYIKKMLQKQNEMGNTALHYAALMGYERICEKITSLNPSLVGARNSAGETALFLAVVRGHKQVFLCLHKHIKGLPFYNALEYCRRENGDTILHSAVAGEYFGTY